MDLFAFTIYGVLLFPSGNEVISLAAIDVFINYKRNGKNAVTPYRCFTFPYFQLVPTLEEFSKNLGYPWKTIASVLQFEQSELESMNANQGYKHRYLKEGIRE
jgi:hypothetical protein